MEADEENRSAAVREVAEECGLRDLDYRGDLGGYLRSAVDGRGRIRAEAMKWIDVFLFSTSSTELKPEDQDNPAALWVTPSELLTLLTHPRDAAFVRQRLPEITRLLPLATGDCDATRGIHVAVILAAGLGTRLGGNDAESPKCCVLVGTKPLIVHTVDALAEAGIRDIVVVVGHRQDAVRAILLEWRPELRYRFVTNPYFRETGTAASLWHGLSMLAPHELPLVIEGDVIMESSLLSRAMRATGSSAVVEPHRPGLEGTFVRHDGSRLSEISRSDWRESDCGIEEMHKTVNVYRLAHSDLTTIVQAELASLVAHDPAAHVEHLIDRCLKVGMLLEPVETGAAKWVEVDDASDLAIARATFGDSKTDGH